jgi:O-antigen/teichoic acid export membrane protein
MIRDIVNTLFYQVLTVLMGFGLSITTARSLGPIGKGELAVVSSTAQVFCLALAVGLPTAIIYFVSQGKIASRACLKLGLLSSAIGIVASCAFILFFLETNFSQIIFGTRTKGLIWLVPLAVGISIASAFASGCLSAQKRFITKNRTSFVSLTSLFTASVYLLLTYEEGTLPPVVFYSVQLVISGALCLILYHLSWTGDSSSSTIDWKKIHGLLRFGSKSVGADILQFLSYRLDYWIVTNLLGAGAVGVYTLGVGLAQYLWLLPGAVSAVLFANVAGDHAFDFERAMRLGRVVLLFCALAAIALSAVINPLVYYIYGDAFIESAIVFSVLCFGVVPFCLSKIFASVLAGRGRIGTNLFAAGIGAVLTVILDFILIPDYGLIGAAVASSIAYIATTFVVLYAITQLSGCNWGQLLFINRNDLHIIRNRTWKYLKKT